MKKIKKLKKNYLSSFLIMKILFCGSYVLANTENLPWMTGPLFAGAGEIVPFRHINIEPYLYYTKTKDTPSIKTWQAEPVLEYGIYHKLEAQLVIPAIINNKKGNDQGSGLGDVNFGIYYQILNANPKTLQPDIALFINETFPTGDYNNLANPLEATGEGAYRTNVQLNFEKLCHISGVHYFRTRFNLIYGFASHTNVHGISAYGDKSGRISLGSNFAAIAGFEYSLTKNWVPALDILYNYNKKNRSNEPTLVSKQNSTLSIAPELEYNFNSHLGIIGGVWFNLTNHNTNDFVSAVIAINYYN